MSSEEERYDLLIGFLEGELDDDERALVEEELAGPGEAQERLEAYRSLGDALAGLEPPAPSQEATDRAMAAVLAAMGAAPQEAHEDAAEEAHEDSEASVTPATSDAPKAQAPARQAPPAGPAPRGQLLSFLSAIAAAALVMVSASLYLQGLESPSKMARAPEKVALETDDFQGAPEQQGAGARVAPAPPEAFAPADEEANEGPAPAAEPAAAGEAVLPNEAQAERLRSLELAKARLREERDALQGLDKAAELQDSSEPQVGDEGASEPPAAPASPPLEGDAEAKAKKRWRRQAPERGFTKQTAPPAPGGEASSADDLAEREEEAPRKRPAREPEQAPAGSAGPQGAGSPQPQPKSAPGDGAPRASGLTPESDADAGPSDGTMGGGGGGGGGAPARPETASQQKRENLAGRSDAATDKGAAKGAKKAADPEALERTEKEAPELGTRSRGRLGGQASPTPQGKPYTFGRLSAEAQLQPAWIVTRGQERVLYVLEGQKLTQAPFGRIETRGARAKQPAEPAERPGAADLEVGGLRVTALEVQRKALAAKRQPVDLRDLERREDLLAIARLELKQDKRRERRLRRAPDTPGARPEPEDTEPEDTGKKNDTSDAKDARAGEGRPKRAGLDEEAPKGGKAAPPPPRPGRERAEVLLRILGAVEGPRPSRKVLREALEEAERRTLRARRR